MSDDRKKTLREKTLSRRKVLAGAAGVAAAAAGSASAQERTTQRVQRQDLQPIGRQPVVRRPQTGPVAELQVAPNVRLDSLSSRVSGLLENDLMLRGQDYSRSMDVINSVMTKLDNDFTGVIVFDLDGTWQHGSLGVPGGIGNSMSTCGTNSCGAHGCGTHTCSAEGCDAQGCGTHTCPSNACNEKDCGGFTSVTGGSSTIAERAAGMQQAWSNLAALHQQHAAMNTVEIQIHHAQAGRIRVDTIQR